MERKWTPGPWTVVLRGERGTFHIPEAQKHEAAHTGDGVDGYTVSSANASLIAAAPELFEALERAADAIKDFDGGDPGMETGWASDELLEAWLVCRAALTKATASKE